MTTSADDTGSFRNSDGFNIFCRYWNPEGTPRALLLLLHGYAEHCHEPRYNDLAKELNKHGFFVFAHDHVGHGKSEGPRAICSSVDVYIIDALAHVDIAKGKYPGLPIFIYGHSMGGLIAGLTLVRRPNEFAAAVFSAPLFATDKAQASWLQTTSARVLGRFLPSLPIGVLDFSNAVKDPAVVARMTEDPLRYHGYIQAGWASAMLTALDEIHSKYDAIHVPVLIEHGTSDKLCNIAGSEEAYKNISSSDKTLKVYKDCYHGLLHEPDGVGDQILQFAVSWCVQRIPSAAS